MQAPYFDARRRTFLTQAAQTAGLLALAGLKPLTTLAKDAAYSKQKAMTVRQIIDLILKEGDLSTLTDTVDTIKAGSADQVVTGIVTTMFPTIPVIEQTARLGANFIVAHEPTFYNHLDNPDWVENNTVVQEKQQLLAKHGIAVWRFHDYIHRLTPDAISYGVAKKANWLPYYQAGRVIHTIPAQSLEQLVQHLKKSLGIDHLRVIGNPAQICRRVALLPGAWGGPRQVGTAERERPDVLIVGEVSEWETAEYVRDAQQLGRVISLVVLGHAVSEEPGMEYIVDWLQPKLPELKITHIPSQNPFRWE
jgi:putative NIF3 family GTP cyclohydrolase 1 type 2